jgi:hypothetical protein
MGWLADVVVGESGSKYDRGRVKNLEKTCVQILKGAQERHDAVFIFAEHTSAPVPSTAFIDFLLSRLKLG